MDSKELRAFVVAKFEEKKPQLDAIKKSIENFCIGVLIDCKTVLVELDSAKKVAGIIIDEIDDRTNSGVFELVDGMILKGIFEKWVDSPKLEKWFLDMRNKALDIIGQETAGEI